MTSGFRIARLDCHVYRAPITTPVQTSFGIMRDRPMVLVRAEDTDGCFGWGEVWCNFPGVGAEHRARLIDSVLAPLLLAGTFASPRDAFAHLERATEILAIQSAEYGPIAQSIAGIDLALWDLAARRQSLPLWKLLGGDSDSVAAYASGLNPTAPETVALRCFAAGYRAFKLKIGFGHDIDLANLARLRDVLGPDVTLMADANQGWALEKACEQMALLRPFELGWLEEPLRADRPQAEWFELSALGIPLAAGENMASDAAFSDAIRAGALSVIQPDVAKWGGITKCFPIAQDIVAAGLRYCPHYLGGGIGLLASAHCLAAAGGDGMLEIDGNANPLRTLLCTPFDHLADGRVSLGHGAGLGVASLPEALQAFEVPYQSAVGAG